MEFMSTEEASQRLGVTPRRVVQLLEQGALDGQRVRRDWMVAAQSVRRRQTLTASRGRPLTPQTARLLLEAIDGNRPLPDRKAELVRRRDTEILASAIAHSIVVESFTTRHLKTAAGLLHLTGESALDRIVSSPSESLVGTSVEVHGYPRNISMEDLIDDAMLVRRDDGPVHVYRFRDDEFPWDETPSALIAIDAARSASSRVRAAGLRAVEVLRTQWLASHTS